jgi:serpin B
MDKDKQVSNQINHWIRSHSGGHIKVVIPQIENGNLLYLVNATFFKGDWQSEFNSGKTATSFFYSENGKAIPSVMMWQKADLNYFENARFQMVNLPYKNPNFSMYVLLPKEGYTINSLMKDLDYQKLRDYKEAMQLKRNINFGMPKFRCEYTMNLKQLMKQTGLDHLFVEEQVEDLGSGVARFGTMVQKTVIDVDEKGTQASVVSSVAASFTNLVDDNPFNLIINHPFIFMIEEKQSNSLLFIGKITKP